MAEKSEDPQTPKPATPAETPAATTLSTDEIKDLLAVISPGDFQKRVDGGKYTLFGTAELTAPKDIDILAASAAIAGMKGITPPEIYLISSDLAPDSQANVVHVGTLNDSPRQGKNALLITQQIRDMDMKAIEGILGHEISHIANGDFTPAAFKTMMDAMATGGPDLFTKLTVGQEGKADIGAASAPLCKGDVLAQALEVIVAGDMKFYMLNNQGATQADFYKELAEQDPRHPPILERIAGLRATEANDPACQKDLPAKLPAEAPARQR